MDLDNESPEDWVQSIHDRIFYRTQGDAYLRGEFAFATYIVNCLPDWKVVITMDPDQASDMSFIHDGDRKIIHVGFNAEGIITRLDKYPRDHHGLLLACANEIIQMAKEWEESDSESG